jgi:hypothetical protein
MIFFIQNKKSFGFNEGIDLKISNKLCYVILEGNFVLKKNYRRLLEKNNVDYNILKESAYTFNLQFLGEGEIINEEKYFYDLERDWEM